MKVGVFARNIGQYDEWRRTTLLSSVSRLICWSRYTSAHTVHNRLRGEEFLSIVGLPGWELNFALPGDAESVWELARSRIRIPVGQAQDDSVDAYLCYLDTNDMSDQSLGFILDYHYSTVDQARAVTRRRLPGQFLEEMGEREYRRVYPAEYRGPVSLTVSDETGNVSGSTIRHRFLDW